MNNIHLKDHKEKVLSMIDESEYKRAKEALDLLIHYDLRYQISTGIIRDTKGIIAKYCLEKDIPLNPTEEEVLKYQLLPIIKNESKRIEYFENSGKSYYY